jgi:hypothetical protein
MVALAGAGGGHKEVAMRRIVLVLGALALSVGVTASPAWSAEGGTDRPHKATFSFTISGVTGAGSGSSIATHIGTGDLQIQATSATTGTVVVTTANGDQIFQTFSNDSATTGVVTFTGGTGRFADVTGEARSTFVVTPTSDPTVVQVTGSLEGTISY